MAFEHLALLGKVREALRIVHTYLDDELVDDIDACLADLAMCGVYVQPAQELDSLVVNAVKLWCLAIHADDLHDRDQYQSRYDALKGSLMISGKYGVPPNV